METKIDKKTLDKLSSKKVEEREAAQASLREVGAAAVIEHLRAEAEKRKSRQRWTRIGFYIYLGIIVTFLIVYLSEGIMTGKWSHFPTGLFTQFGVFGSFGAAAVSASAKNGTKWLAEKYGDDVRIVGPLAEALEMGDKNLKATAEEALIQQLPRLQASDAHLLDDDQRAILRRAVKGENRILVLAILKAWEQVGDSKAIPEVEQLVAGGYKVGNNAEIQAAAKDCLSHLRILAEQERASQLLVRAAESPTDASHILLRPAHDVGDNSPDRLVRPIDASDEQLLNQQK